MADTRFVEEYGSETQAINNLADRVQQVAQTEYTVDADGGTIALTAVQVVNGVFRITGGTTSAVTFPSAASVVAEIPNAQVGSSFDFVLHNGGTGTATLTAGTGNTLVGTTDPTTLKSLLVKGLVTNATVGAEAVTYIGLGGLI